MKKTLKKWKVFLALILSVVMVITGRPLTALAAPDETISTSEEETQTGTIRDEDASEGEQGEEGRLEEGTGKDSEGEKGNEGESGKDTGEGEEETGKDAGDSEGETGKDAEDGEGEAGKDAEGGEEELGKDSETGEVEADQDSEDEEETEEDTEIEESEEGEEIEEADESVESAEEIMLMSASDFVITNGVLKSYTGTEEDVEIPTGVVTIGASAFENNKTIKTVKFSSSVKTIGSSAFRGCTALKEVTLNEGLETIGDYAFREAAFGEKFSTGKVESGKLTIPSTVKSIGVAAFLECSCLGEIKFENGATEVLELSISGTWGTIKACPTLTKMELPSRLKRIPEYAFGGNANLTEVVFGDKLESIGDYAFCDSSSLKSIDLPASVRTIGDYAFRYCSSLKSVDLEEGLETIGRFAFSESALGEKLSTGKIEPGILIIPSTVKSIAGGAFNACSYLGEVQFKNGDTQVLEIASAGTWGTIASCPVLTKMELPSRLKTIPAYAFIGNVNLTEVVFGDQIETVGSEAFYGCSSLKRIDLPASVVTIENAAFSGCSSLRSADLKEGLVTIGSCAFYGAAFGEKLSTGKIKTGTLVIPSTVQKIEAEAFYNCAYLGEVQFRDGDTIVLELGYRSVFMKCPMLTRVELPSRLTTIPWKTFYGDKSLAEVVYGGTIESIGDYAFYGCSNLRSIELKEGLITIGRDAFYGAALGDESSSTGTLVIPSTVQSIYSGAFCECAYLKKIIFANGDTVVLEMLNGIDSCPELTTVILPERLTRLSGFLFSGNKKLQTLYIPAGVTEIEIVNSANAIWYCPKLTIYGVSGSAAETYAKQNKIPFKSKESLKGDFAVKSVKVTPGVIEEIGESAIGKTTRLTATVLPDTAQNRTVSYASDDETVAAVDQKGLVTIKGYGETRITVTTEDGGKTASCMVVVLKEAIDERSDITEANVLFPNKKTEYSAVYTGEQIRPTMTVTYTYTDANSRAKTQTLKLNVDYTLSYRNNVNVGENNASVTIRGIGEYKGVTTKTFTITPKNIQNVTLSQVGDITYGETPSITVMDGTYELTKDKDYEMVLSTTGSASEDTPSVLSVKGMGNYTGTSKKSAKFNILKTGTDIQPIASKSISVAFKKLPAKGYTYNGKAQKPAVVVTDTSTGKKVAASNYKVIYTNNINAGTASVRVVGVSRKGKGFYGISEALTFEIKPKDLSKVKVSTKGLIPKAGTIEDMKKSVEEALTVKDGKHVLSTDEYEIDYGNIRNAGDIKAGTKYPITLTAGAGGNYASGTQKVFNIKFGQLSFASWTAKINVRIINAEQNEILLRYNGTLLEKGKDYTAVVKKDKNRDTYTVTVKAVKNSAYKGSRTFKRLSAENQLADR